MNGTTLNYIDKIDILIKSAVDAIILTIREKQGILIDDMDFVFNSKQDDLNTLSPIQRLYLADYKRISQNKKSLYVDKTLNIRYAPKIITYNKNYQYETIKQHLLNHQKLVKTENIAIQLHQVKHSHVIKLVRRKFMSNKTNSNQS